MIKNLISKDYELIIKNDCIDIKNYLKINEISNNKIEVLLLNKKIIINGIKLIINCMDEYEIVIKSEYSSIQLIDE